MRFMYIATHGSEDPTRATLPFHMAKGARDAGYEVEIALLGDSVVLFNDTVADGIQGLGVPPLKELRQFARDNKIPVFGWGACCRGRGVAEEIVRKWSDTGYLDAKVLAGKVAAADRVISIWVDNARAA